jgi:hypothetical protein
MIIFERIFPYAASSLDSVKPFLDSHAHSLLGLAKVGNVKATIDLQPVFAMLGADDAPGNYRFAGALKKVNATWLVVGDPRTRMTVDQAACLGASGPGAPQSVIPASPSALAVCRAAS